MRVDDSSIIPDLKLIRPEVHHDFRGEFAEVWSAAAYRFEDAAGEELAFVEDDISVSARSTLRGLHGDRVTWKLFQCVHGAVYAVVVDMREGSPGHLRWDAFPLNGRNRWQLLIPAGCVTGHLVLEDRSVCTYKQSRPYSGAEGQMSVRWSDPQLGIHWPVSDPILSRRDATAPLL